ncbi:hypothetical protein I302_102234 [Kwoniella bestiolae CBS 10118]|uniref:Uncharacterized protein n=1 Tax=Kwoniella bestiolae CBS 10118 TaxID=1296100 RepID=A0A1B9GEI1_9TREE|nr:hypothetical protein I302_00923 [Kwoniella bestiolae CBS 10118]OCF29418.1 hypothetical protein I302_00923 [Kwoniella bestiolae CBS 10118]
MSNAQSSTKQFVSSPPAAQAGMSATPGQTTYGAMGGATTSERGGSGSSSLTVVEERGRVIPGLSLTASPSNTSKDGRARTKYDEWYPGDASHNGRPAWWNRWFCCGYGLGCLLCPCSSWTCKHERS